MDTSKLVKAIQLIVKEEVKKEMAKKEKAIRESILKEMKSTVVKKQTIDRDPLDVDHIFETSHKTKQTFTGNSMLNDILNETAQGSEWRSINGPGGVFQSSQAQGWGSMTQHPSVLQSAEGNTVSVERLQQTEAGQAVVNALTRDYSTLMKHIDAKKGK
jgi:hypothetical protein